MVWRICTASQSPALGIASFEEIDRLEVHPLLSGRPLALVLPGEGRVPCVEGRMNDFGCWHPRVCLRPVSYLALLHADKALATSVVIRGGFRIHHRERPNKAPEPTPTSVTGNQR